MFFNLDEVYQIEWTKNSEWVREVLDLGEHIIRYKCRKSRRKTD